MSHFNLLVFTEGKPSQEELDGILAPWHEFECTGVENKYVQDIDITEEARKEYESDTERRLKDPEGNLYDPYDDSNKELFYRPMTPEEIESDGGPMLSTKTTLVVPEGWEDIKVPTKDVKTFVEWVEDWYGYKPVTTKQVRIETFADGDKPKNKTVIINGSVDWDDIKYGYVLVEAGDGFVPAKDRTVLKVVKRTNPNSKWDWWQIGGRFANKFTLEKVEDNPNNWEVCFLCGGTGIRNDDVGKVQRAINPDYTCNGCKGKGKKLKWPTHIESTGDQVHLASLDYNTLKKKAMNEREEWIQDIINRTNERAKTNYTRDHIKVALHLRKLNHEEWLKLPEPRPCGNEFYDWIRAKGGDYVILADIIRCNWEIPEINPGQTLQKWIEEAPTIQCFAIIKDGKWYERGEMGWWGMVSDEKDYNEWGKQLDELIQNHTDETWVTSIDCHI